MGVPVPVPVPVPTNNNDHCYESLYGPQEPRQAKDHTSKHGGSLVHGPVQPCGLFLWRRSLVSLLGCAVCRSTQNAAEHL